MLTSEIFLAAGFPIRADTIEDQGAGWLCRMRVMVESWAAECRLDVADAIDADLGIWEPVPPVRPIDVDVIIPFCVADQKFVRDCVWSILGQRFVRPTLHVVSDGSEWPDLPQVDNLIRYQTEGGWGPYRITNAVFHNFRSDFIAIQDGDDLSRPDRLWRQLQTLKYHRAEMISSAAVNFLDWESTEDPGLQNRMKIEPVIRPGTIYASTPRGRLVNNTRTMKRDMFERLNGFGGQFCTGDFQLDNRARFAGVRIVDDQTIQADRRLHSSSLTGGSFKIGTKQRTEDMGRCMLAVTKMTDSPTEDTARSLGSLDRAEKLIPI